MQTYRIAILAYNGCIPTELFAMRDTLGIACDIARDVAIELEVCIVAVEGREVAVSGGTRMRFSRPRGKFDFLIVPGMETRRDADWPDKLARLAPEAAYIKKTYEGGTHIASVCIGAFLIGAAGLLDDRKVTTSWLFAHDLATCFPGTTVDAGEILLEDNNVTTTAAVSSVFDLALHMVKQLYGIAVAEATARIALLNFTRTSQAPYVDSRLLADSAPSFSSVLSDWFAQRLAVPYDVTLVAEAFHISPRTLMRRVKKETGLSPLTLLQQARVEHAKRLLLQTSWSVDRITESVGYQDKVSFGRLFQRLVGVSLANYRRTFKLLKQG